MKHALEQYPDIQNNTRKFQAILNHADLMEAPYFSAEQKLLIYRSHRPRRRYALSGASKADAQGFLCSRKSYFLSMLKFRRNITYRIQRCSNNSSSETPA